MALPSGTPPTGAAGAGAPVPLGLGVARLGRRAEDLVIAGLVKYSTCDWPGKLVATVFLQGCPWNCGYCQNPDLMDPRAPGRVTWEEVTKLAERRRGLLDGIVFSGGEPTRQLGLAAALDQVRALGLMTGLHTAGAYPARLAAVLPALDWVGLDIKALAHHYGTVTGVETAGQRAFDALGLVVASGVDHEVRITVDPVVHTEDHLRELIELVKARGARRVVLQEARAEGARPAYGAALANRRLRDVIGQVPEGVEVRA
jgi:pyruvate formate lyase activating enzyme